METAIQMLAITVHNISPSWLGWRCHCSAEVLCVLRGHWPPNYRTICLGNISVTVCAGALKIDTKPHPLIYIGPGNPTERASTLILTGFRHIEAWRFLQEQ